MYLFDFILHFPNVWWYCTKFSFLLPFVYLICELSKSFAQFYCIICVFILNCRNFLYILYTQILFYISYCCSVAKLCLTLCHPMEWSIPASSVPHCLLEFVCSQLFVFWSQFMSIESVMLSNHLILWEYLPVYGLPIHLLNEVFWWTVVLHFDKF